MNKLIKWVRKVPGWMVMVLVSGGLFLSGLHTEVIGQLQRIVLVTGLIKPDINPTKEKSTSADANSSGTAALSAADYNFSLQTLQGEEVLLESLKGKVIFMNFWATWCPPCIAEMPNIQSLYEKVKSDKIAFVMVSLDHDPAKAEKFISKKGFTFPVYTPDGPVPPVYEGQVIPSTFVISPDGYIVARKKGMADYDNQEFRRFLKNLVNSNKALSTTKASGSVSINSQ